MPNSQTLLLLTCLAFIPLPSWAVNRASIRLGSNKINLNSQFTDQSISSQLVDVNSYTTATDNLDSLVLHFYQERRRNESAINLTLVFLLEKGELNNRTIRLQNAFGDGFDRSVSVNFSKKSKGKVFTYLNNSEDSISNAKLTIKDYDDESGILAGVLTCKISPIDLRITKGELTRIKTIDKKIPLRVSFTTTLTEE